MSKAINPQQSSSSAADTARTTGINASAASLNALLIPNAHMAGRIVPIYSMRPTAHNPNSSAYIEVDGWDVPYYPTHGLWRDDDEDAWTEHVAASSSGPQRSNSGRLILSLSPATSATRRPRHQVKRSRHSR